MSHQCPDCRTVHPSNAARIVGMFGGYNGTGKPAFRAAYPGAPLRGSRIVAEADYCLHRAEGA